MFYVTLAVIIALVWVYLLFLRPILKARFPAVWAQFDMIEGWLFANSRTFIMSRLTIVGSIVVGIHDALAQAGFDYEPLIKFVQDYVPQKYWFLIVPAGFLLYGLVQEIIKRTQKTQATDQ